MKRFDLLVGSVALSAVALLDCGTPPRASPDATALDSAVAPDAAQDASRQDADAGSPTERFYCSDCPHSFPGPTTPACDAQTVSAPSLAYPPDGVLLPPNVVGLEVQFSMPISDQLSPFVEIDFSNATTDVRIVTRCIRIAGCFVTTPCGFQVTPDETAAIANQNRGGAPLALTVRATPISMSCTANSDTRHIAFAEQDLYGRIYYNSTAQTQSGPPLSSVLSFEFATADFSPRPVAGEFSPQSCFGCHSVSRDGWRAAYTVALATGSPVPTATTVAVVDTDLDELLLAADLASISNAFSPSDSTLISTTTGTASLRCVQADGSQTSLSPSVDPSGSPVTMFQPDIAPDGSHMVFVRPATAAAGVAGAHGEVSQGELWDMAADPTEGFCTLGTLRRLVPAQLLPTDAADPGEYYPSYSPDGLFLVFNHVGTGNSHANPGAQVWMATSDGSSRWALDTLNQGSGLTNSWPHWVPQVQQYRNQPLYWVVFSSMREYGLRLGPLSQPRAQLWMAAVTGDPSRAGSDQSFPAFWVPNQDLETGNFGPQWSPLHYPGCALDGAPCPDADAGAQCCPGLHCDPVAHACLSNACVPEHGACPGPGATTCCNPDVNGHPLACTTLGFCEIPTDT